MSQVPRITIVLLFLLLIFDISLFLVLQYLSESEDISISPISSFALPLLSEGAVASSEKRMVIAKPPPKSLTDSFSRLSSIEVEATSHQKVKKISQRLNNISNMLLFVL